MSINKGKYGKIGDFVSACINYIKSTFSTAKTQEVKR